jgi:uncharacterized DUF497 family protein
MSGLSFEWASSKAAANHRKPGVTFEEARSAFSDENARVIPDTEHSDDDVISIISARKADPSEQKQYADFL